MNLLIKALLLVALVIQIDKSDAWVRFRVPRINVPRISVPRISAPRISLPRITVPRWLCRYVCTTTCVAVTDAPVCSWGCRKVCKRSIEKRAAENGKFDLRLPCKFETWDLNSDGSVSLGELAFAGHTGPNKATKAVFEKVDFNGDGKISEAELDNSSIVRGDC